MIRRGGEVPLYDGFGSVRAHTNSSQSMKHSQSVEAFGQSLSTSGSTSDPYGFGGF